MNEYSGKFPIGVVYLFVVVLLCVSGGVFSGCGEQERPTSTEPVVVLPDRLEIVSKPVRHDYNYGRAIILRDNLTGQEFLWIANSSSSVVIRIGHDLEYIEKPRTEHKHE